MTMNNKDTVEAPELRTENPFEQQIEVALIKAGESYTTDHDGSNASHLDFCLTNRDIHIEVKTMHSDRVAEQMSRVSDVIVTQGQRAIAYLASLIARVDPPAAPECKPLGYTYERPREQQWCVTHNQPMGRCSAPAAPDEADKALAQSVFAQFQHEVDELAALCDHGYLNPAAVDRLVETTAQEFAAALAQARKDQLEELRAAPCDSSIQAAARHYFCSCGGALTAEEYIEHYFEKGHDRGEPSAAFKAAAAEICAYFGDTELAMGGHVNANGVAAILSKRLGSAAVGEQGESGWLLEKMHNGNVHYICADYVLEWTDDPNKALRLSRREDAEALCTIVEDCEKIASHEWVPAATPTSTQT